MHNCTNTKRPSRNFLMRGYERPRKIKMTLARSSRQQLMAAADNKN